MAACLRGRGHRLAYRGACRVNHSSLSRDKAGGRRWRDRDGRGAGAADRVGISPWDAVPPTYLVRDNDGAYGQTFTRRLRAMGIRDRPISPRSPWQNPYVERLIGTLRRDCLDHILIFDERHLRRVLTSYSLYYNETVQRSGTIIITPIFCGAVFFPKIMSGRSDDAMVQLDGRRGEAISHGRRGRG